jgi:hypothetical protein
MSGVETIESITDIPKQMQIRITLIVDSFSHTWVGFYAENILKSFPKGNTLI